MFCEMSFNQHIIGFLDRPAKENDMIRGGTYWPYQPFSLESTEPETQGPVDGEKKQ
jgi:hypothetical protein